MSDFHILVALYAKEGREAELREKLIEAVGPSRQEEGSLAYDLFVDQDDPRRFVFIEHWASPEAQHRHHTESEHIRRFQESGAEAIERMELISRLDRLA